MSVSCWEELRQALRLPPVPDDLLEQAFRHGSFVREVGLDPVASNQRLEFLGDAVLDLIVAEQLYRDNPELHEGLLTKTKASAVRAGSLARLAGSLDLGRYLLLGRGEDESGGRSKGSLLADALEALLGAIYLACGLEATRDFLLPHLGLAQHCSEPGFSHFDHKTLLQELVQSRTKRLPTYRVVATTGPAHNLTFTVQVRFGELVIGVGGGASKRKAQQDAAREALANRGEWLPRLRLEGEPSAEGE
jgi:ribonuclease III